MTWRSPVVTAPPAAEPVSVPEAKAQLSIDGSDHDTVLAIYIRAARTHVESYTGLRLITQTALLRASRFADLVRLPTAPIAGVTAIHYLDADGAVQLLDPAVYEAVLPGLEPEVRLKPGQSWPALRSSSDAVRVTATCGYGAAGADVPEAIRLAMLMLIGDFMANREGTNIGNIVNALPNGVESLLEPYRLFA